MNIEEIRNYCIKKKGASESFPFNETTLVFKVQGKMFALLSLDSQNRITLKADPEQLISLSEQKDYVLPGYHMNKKFWISVLFNRASDEEIIKWIDHSYDEVIKSLPNLNNSHLS